MKSFWSASSGARKWLFQPIVKMKPPSVEIWNTTGGSMEMTSPWNCTHPFEVRQPATSPPHVPLPWQGKPGQGFMSSTFQQVRKRSFCETTSPFRKRKSRLRPASTTFGFLKKITGPEDRSLSGIRPLRLLLTGRNSGRRFWMIALTSWPQTMPPIPWRKNNTPIQNALPEGHWCSTSCLP